MVAKNGLCTEDPEKRLAILEQAIRTFAEQGFRRADVQVIADNAGVGKGTIYRYFRSKEDLFWATTLEVFMRLDRQVVEAMNGAVGACEKLRAAALAHAAFFAANPQYIELIVQDRAEFPGVWPESHREHREKMLSQVDEVLCRGIETGELRPLDTRQTTFSLGCLLFGTIMLEGRLDSVDIRTMTEYAVDIFLRGIRKESNTP